MSNNQKMDISDLSDIPQELNILDLSNIPLKLVRHVRKVHLEKLKPGESPDYLPSKAYFEPGQNGEMKVENNKLIIMKVGYKNIIKDL